MAFGGRELVVLRTKPSMFGKFGVACLEVVWRLERGSFYLPVCWGSHSYHFGVPGGAKTSLAFDEP
jgi:hypothetical protein